MKTNACSLLLTLLNASVVVVRSFTLQHLPNQVGTLISKTTSIQHYSNKDDDQDDEAWDSEGVGAPHVLRLDDGSSRMYYTGQGKGGTTAIGVAKSTNDIEWTREQAQFSFAL